MIRLPSLRSSPPAISVTERAEAFGSLVLIADLRMWMALPESPVILQKSPVGIRGR
jgi:hypothetical protein